jgi:hypothetical protein
VTKTLFVDLDDTLLVPGRSSKRMWRLAKWFQTLGRRRQRLNPVMVDAIRKYDRVILLTSRDVSDAEATQQFLEAQGIHISEARFCPRRELFAAWKGKVIDETVPEGSVDWIDDLFDRDGPSSLPRSSGSGELRRLPVPRTGATSDPRDSEPPSL